VVEIKKFEAMLSWAKHRIKTKSTKLDAKVEFNCIMERLSRDLKLYRITPYELIKVRIEEISRNMSDENINNITE